VNNKEFISALAARMSLTTKECQQLTDSFLAELAVELAEGTPLTVQGFGNFDVKKKMERIVVNPATKQRMLVPPKLVLGFKPGPMLKEKLKDEVID
jgi:DNA-binding protein HU-beta